MTRTLDGRELWSRTERDMAELGKVAAFGLALENGATVNRYGYIRANVEMAAECRRAA